MKKRNRMGLREEKTSYGSSPPCTSLPNVAKCLEDMTLLLVTWHARVMSRMKGRILNVFWIRYGFGRERRD